jgi:hypothetical protein
MACAAVKIEGGDAAKISAMAPAAKITAMQTATSDAMAKMHVDLSKIPNSGTANQGGTMARAEFEKLAPKAQTAFFANGGKLTQ